MDVNNLQQDVYEPHILIDEYSSSEIYYGTSVSSSDTIGSTWRIRRAKKVGNVWSFKYPNGDQSFGFAWDDRLTYIYY